MAAEKLTKARLVQILVIFIILATAFTWRTFQHKPEKNAEITCVINQPCRLKVGEIELSILFSQTLENRLKVSTQLTDYENKKEKVILSLDSNIIPKRKVDILKRSLLLTTVSEWNNSRWAVSTLEGKVQWFNLQSQND